MTSGVASLVLNVQKGVSATDLYQHRLKLALDVVLDGANDRRAAYSATDDDDLVAPCCANVLDLDMVVDQTDTRLVDSIEQLMIEAADHQDRA